MENDNIFEYVNSQAKILDVVSYFLGANKIIKKGNSYKTICPFHQDHDPSLSIDVNKNICKCFVCGKGGNPITFTSEFLHISKIDALKKVAEICSISLPDNFKVEKRKDLLQEKYPKELSALKELNKFYNVSLNLKEGNICKEYLAKRNIDEDTRKDFSLGYAPFDSSLAIKALVDKKYDLQTLVSAGILKNSFDNKDQFSSRLVFPLIDENDNIVAFAARQLIKDENSGKYINYPESHLFHKSELLYNLNNAKKYFSINPQQRCLYIVEGYMDAIALYKSGIKNVVACMTSTISENQIKKIKRYNVQVRLLLDSDNAGQDGIERCLIPLLKENIDTYVVKRFDLINEGKDPDEVLSNKGKDYLLNRINVLFDPFIFIISRHLNENKKIESELEKKILFKKLINYYPYVDKLNKNKDLDILAKVTSTSKEDIISYFNNDIKLSENTLSIKKEAKKYKRMSLKEIEESNRRELSKNITIKDTFNNELFLISQISNVCITSSYTDKSISKMLIKNETAILIKFVNDYKAFSFSKMYKNNDDEEFEFAYYPFYIINLILNILYANKKENKKLNSEDFNSFLNDINKLKDKDLDNENINIDDNYVAIFNILKTDYKLYALVVTIIDYLSTNFLNLNTNIDDLKKSFDVDFKYQNDNSSLIILTEAKDGISLDEKNKKIIENKRKLN